MNIVKQEIKVIDGLEYNYVEYDKQLEDGTPYSELTYIQTEVDITNKLKEQRISELKEIITNKKYVDMDCTAEQVELKGLLGL